MILQGKSNHYGVKFLNGCDPSISVKNSKVILKNCADPLSPVCINDIAASDKLSVREARV